MSQHILISIDGSDESEAILRKGLALANPRVEQGEQGEQRDAQVSVIHAMELPMPMVGELALVDTYFDYAEYAKLTKESLVKLVKKAGLPEECLHIVTGSPATTVVDYAKEKNVDLIVTGSHGKSGFKLLLGSVAAGILHKAACDVYVYRIKGS